jgi:hypothetical protein
MSCSSSLLETYDEPEILRCSNPQICPTGADVRHPPPPAPSAHACRAPTLCRHRANAQKPLSWEYAAVSWPSLSLSVLNPVLVAAGDPLQDQSGLAFNDVGKRLKRHFRSLSRDAVAGWRAPTGRAATGRPTSLPRGRLRRTHAKKAANPRESGWPVHRPAPPSS